MELKLKQEIEKGRVKEKKTKEKIMKKGSPDVEGKSNTHTAIALLLHYFVTR